MAKPHVTVTGLSEMRSYFDHEVDREITKTKVKIIEIVHTFAERVRQNVPVGPPKRGKDSPYYAGFLRDSVSQSAADYGDEVHGEISIGEGSDYLWYVQADLAREGKDFLRGADDAEDAIYRAMRGEVE